MASRFNVGRDDKKKPNWKKINEYSSGNVKETKCINQVKYLYNDVHDAGTGELGMIGKCQNWLTSKGAKE